MVRCLDAAILAALNNEPSEWSGWNESEPIQRQKELSVETLLTAIERGKILHRLRLNPAEYQEKNIGITARAGQMLVNLATSPRTYRTDWNRPCSWRAVYELVKYDARDGRYSGINEYRYAVSERIFEELIQPGKDGFTLVGYDSTRRNVRDAINLCRSRIIQSHGGKQPVAAITAPAWANQIVCGDCLDVIPTLPDLSLGAAIMSPPYADRMKNHYPGKPADEYVAWFCAIMTAIYPKLKNDGSVIVVIRAHEEKGWVNPYMLLLRVALLNIGWGEPQEWIWDKPDGGAGQGANKKLRHTWENVLWFAKKGKTKPYVNALADGRLTNQKGYSGRNPKGVIRDVSARLESGIARDPDVFRFPVGKNEKGNPHPAPYPLPLVQSIIKKVTRPGDTILDPFIGSGTTALAARSLGRNYYGIDIVQKFVDLANRRLAAAR